MTLHGALSIILNIKPGKKESLERLLQEIDKDVNQNSLIPFSKFSDIHFARFIVLDKSHDVNGNPIQERLIFTTNHDLPFDKHLNELIQFGGNGLWKVFSMCDNFIEGEYDDLILRKFITENNYKAETFYVGVGDRSVTEIKEENILRKEIEKFIDDNRDNLIMKDEIELRKDIQNFVFENKELEFANIPVPEPPSDWTFVKIAKLMLVIIGVILFLPLVILFLLIWMTIVLIIESNTKDEKCFIDREHVRELLNNENGIVQNQFSAYGNLKPGFFRLTTLKFILALTDFLAPYIFSKGRLSGIPTVHFARWIILSEGRQMIFLSNYDGNSEGYLRDFINIAAKQLTLIFTHVVGYPKTRLMIFGGAKDAKGFMEWARQNQLITNVWFNAYPDLSVKNIFRNSKIRNGLYGEMNEIQAGNWLKLF